MSKAKVYNLKGEVVGEQELNPALFSVEINPLVVQQVLVAQQANKRRPWAHTKTRPEVRGGGRKPWKQKGTGNARHGSIRSPLWRGGGVTFGPRKERNYTKAVNKKMKQSALRMVLSDRAALEQIVLVDSLELPEVKTKQVVQALEKLPRKGYKTLFVTDNAPKNLVLSSKNLQDVKTVSANSLNVQDLLDYRTIVIPVSALETMTTLYSAKK